MCIETGSVAAATFAITPENGRLLFGGFVPVEKHGLREASGPVVVARFVTPFRKVI
jgi:hypothetical protein